MPMATIAVITPTFAKDTQVENRMTEPNDFQKKKRVASLATPMPRTEKPASTSDTLSNARGFKWGQPTVNGNSSPCGSDIGTDVTRPCKPGLFKSTPQTLPVMDRQGIRPDFSTYSWLLQECVNRKTLPEGKLLHAHLIRTEFINDTFLETKLVIMYAKCGSLMDARRVFNEIPERNVISWTVMIAAYAKHGHGDEALELFYEMLRSGIQPNQYTFATVLSACANSGALEQGRKVHQCISTRGLQCNTFLGNSLVDMYAKCGNVEDARKVFDKMPQRDMVSWNSMIAGYAQNRHFDEALEFFRQMQLIGARPDPFTFTCVLSACANMPTLNHGKEVHASITRYLFQSQMFVSNALIDMYAKCGSTSDARQVFDRMPERDLVSWTVMIAACTRGGYTEEALMLYYQMQQMGIRPNQLVFASVLPACAKLAALKHGKVVHEDINRSKFRSDIVVGNALVDMYAKCRSIEDAREVFEEMFDRDVISWNTMIAGYAQNGYFDEALKLFRQLQLTDVKPNAVTFSSVLAACANLAALRHGKEIHQKIIRSGLQPEVFVGSALVDMYAKCGSIDDSCRVFDKMPERDVVSWTVMIVGYAMHGRSKEALQLFERMQQSGTNPDHVTFIGVLSACCHAGLVDDGCQYFDCMIQDHHIIPAMEHYCCMVDLLGRAGLLDEALHFINKMPIKPNAAVWGSLFAACRIQGNIELAEHVAENIFELEPENAANYVLLSNIYAAAGRWDHVEKVRKLMKDGRIKKSPGCSWIEINKKVHFFLTGDRSHPEATNIYTKLERLSEQIKKVGYVPDTNLVLHDVEEELKENIICHHSEKLAIAYGLIHTSPGTPIRIVKNLRVCGDCHSATKFISKIVAQEIVVRDASRFHHFKDGQCSCGDYW